MKFLIILWTIGFIVWALVVHLLKTNMEEKLGTACVIGKDTLTIVDYSIWYDCYYLSNGSKVNKKYIEK